MGAAGGTALSDSPRVSVVLDTPAALASSGCEKSMRARPARICAAVVIWSKWTIDRLCVSSCGRGIYAAMAMPITTKDDFAREVDLLIRRACEGGVALA